ncbi:hypothetical protein [Streptomyces orinoci]|uniref:Integral membrane protein n=1 Tax=Streptomyces orinoci TaxID=67339 RepID=A0ABV3JTR8_STRON|nr:hypothetical protein [Streptomyces orinoci]
MDTGRLGSESVRVPQGQRGRYVFAGVGAVLLALVCLGWAVDSARRVGTGEYLKFAFDGSWGFYARYGGQGMDTYHLYMGVALAVFGALALAGRRVARGGLMALSLFMALQSVRALIAFHDERYRMLFGHGGDRWTYNVLTEGASVVVGVLILLVLAVVSPGGRYVPPPPAYGPGYAPPVDARPVDMRPAPGYPPMPPQPPGS